MQEWNIPNITMEKAEPLFHNNFTSYNKFYYVQ